MTRPEAITKAACAVAKDYDGPGTAPFVSGHATPSIADVVTILETLGLVRFEEPLPKTHHVPMLSYSSLCGAMSALIREDTLIETLRMAGYVVCKQREP